MHALIEKDLVFRIVGCAFEVHRVIGHGFREKTYENALRVELRIHGMAVEQQKRFPIDYRSVRVDEFVPDLIVEGRVIIDTKTVDRIIDEHRGTMLNYLRIAGVKVGLIINFKHPKLEWERLVLDRAR